MEENRTVMLLNSILHITYVFIDIIYSFKMHFRPAGMEIDTNGLQLGTLLNDLSPTKVMGDFLRYSE